MTGESAIKSIFDYVLSKSRADETQITFHSEHSYLTRFANSAIHQNVMEKNNQLSIKTIIGKKIAEATTNSLKKPDILNVLEKSIRIACHEKDNPDFFGLPSEKKYRKIRTYFKSTHLFPQKKKIQIIKDIIKSSPPFQCFGAFTLGSNEIAIANSKGLFAYNRGTDATLRLTMRGENGSSSGECSSREINKLNFVTLKNDVYRRTKMAQNPRDINPGRYTVLLSPEAVSDIIGFLGFFGFNSLLYSEKRSCLTGKLRKKLFSEKFTLYDNPFDESGFAFPFDFEGMPKKKVLLVDRGVVSNLVYDRITARKAAKSSTGHFVSYETGPFPFHLVVKRGTTDIKEMIREITTGIAITTFHYVNVVDPNSLVLTGMTRNGTFMVKNGEIAYPLKNLRFNQSVLEALKNIASISCQARLVSTGGSYGSRFPLGSLLPYIAINDFNFTGVTEF